MGKKPDLTELEWSSCKISVFLNRYPSLTPLAAVQSHPPHACLLDSPELRTFLTRNMRGEGEVPPSAPISALIQFSALSLLLFLQHHSPSDGSKTLSSLTQPRPYLASRRPRHPHQISTVFQHTCGLRFSDRRPVPFVSLLFAGLEGQLASMEMTRMGMESHHHVADGITPSQIFLSWGGFAMRTDWRNSHPKHCETTSNFSPSSSPSSMPKSTWSSATIAQTLEEREGRRHRRGLRFSCGGTGEVRR